MKISTHLRFLFCTFVATALTLSATAQTASGAIKAARVQGEVSRITSDGKTITLKDGDQIGETDSILTGKTSSVVLVFMNGSSVRLGAETRLAIDEFKMDPLAEPISNPSALKNEPSKSKTTLNLSYGEMVGDVKKLNASSSYSIKTPVGAAGIRGTIYRIVYKPSSDGKAFFTVSTAEGKVVMEGVTTQEIPVDAGKEVVVEIDTENPTTPKIVTQDLPPATVAAITVASQEITQTVKETILENPPTKQEETPTKQEETPAKQEVTAPPPAEPQQPTTQLTPGAGK